MAVLRPTIWRLAQKWSGSAGWQPSSWPRPRPWRCWQNQVGSKEHQAWGTFCFPFVSINLILIASNNQLSHRYIRLFLIMQYFSWSHGIQRGQTNVSLFVWGPQWQCLGLLLTRESLQVGFGVPVGARDGTWIKRIPANTLSTVLQPHSNCFNHNGFFSLTDKPRESVTWSFLFYSCFSCPIIFHTTLWNALVHLLGCVWLVGVEIRPYLSMIRVYSSLCVHSQEMLRRLYDVMTEIKSWYYCI